MTRWGTHTRHPFVSVHAGEARCLLDLSQHGSFALDQQDVPYVAAVLERRPNRGLGVS